MSYSTIFVYLSNEEQTPRLMNVAKRLAVSNGAHLVGLHVTPGVEIYPGITYPVDPRIFTDLANSYEKTAEDCKAAFLAETDGEDFVAEWRRAEAGNRPVAEVATENARFADLVICSQPDPDRDDYATIVVEQLILESGRPVLIVPTSANIKSIGDTPVLAWNGSKESCRAAFDALPLLKGAKLVTLLEVAKRGGDGREEEMAAGDMCATLDRHGVKCEVNRTVAADIGVGDELLSRLADKGADLLVMGGYGHSRMREFVLGGATRHILHHMTVPVLMSH
jgi:nucleotide-binding universal stress UspA family protein